MNDSPAYLKSRMNNGLIQRISPFVLPRSKMDGFMSKLSKQLFFETILYGIASKFSKDYTGGRWNFVEGPKIDAADTPVRFVYPDSDTPFAVSNENNYFEGVLSPVDFGIGVTLIALSNASFQDRTETSTRSYHALMTWLNDQSDIQTELFGFID